MEGKNTVTPNEGPGNKGRCQTFGAGGGSADGTGKCRGPEDGGDVVDSVSPRSR